MHFRLRCLSCNGKKHSGDFRLLFGCKFRPEPSPLPLVVSPYASGRPYYTASVVAEEATGRSTNGRTDSDHPSYRIMYLSDYTEIIGF